MNQTATTTKVITLLAAPLLIVFGVKAAESGPKPVSPHPAKVTIGPRELIRGRENMPFVMDSSLATLRRDQDSWFFYHTVDWGKRIEKWRGTPSNPFEAKVWQKTRDEVFDLHGQYTNVHHAGLWLVNIHRMTDGKLMGVVHVELHPGEPAVNHGENYALGLVVAGVNVVAVDAVASYLMGFDPTALVYLKVAASAGLGQNDVARLRVYTARDGELAPCRDVAGLRHDPPFTVITGVKDEDLGTVI